MSAVAEAFPAMPGVSPGVYTNADFEAVREIVYEVAGIVLAPGKAMLVYARLAPLVRASRLGTFARYVERIVADPAERRKAINALTTNHTFFFREGHHFEHLTEAVRPGLVRRALAGERLRVWSAGCSSGEEPWSLAMTLLGSDRAEGRKLAERDIVLLATDLADHALANAAKGEYPVQAVEAVPDALRRNWLAESGDRATIGPDARRIARFRRLNLLEPWPMRGAFDVIFCRNVMIYFDQPTKERLIARLCDQLAPGGYLYIGHSERVTGPAVERLTLIGSTIYRRAA